RNELSEGQEPLATLTAKAPRQDSNSAVIARERGDWHFRRRTTTAFRRPGSDGMRRSIGFPISFAVDANKKSARLYSRNHAASQVAFVLSYLYPAALFRESLLAFMVSHHLPSL